MLCAGSEPKYKSAAVACVLLFLRNMTCASKRKQNDKIDESSKIERMEGASLDVITSVESVQE